MIPFLKDFEVKFKDEVVKDQIAKVICSEIKNQIGLNEPTYSRMDACEYNYLGWSIWKRQNKKKNKPWPGACDFWSGLTEWIICAISARVDQILFSVEPTMTASPVESGDAAKAPEITDFADVIMREVVQLRKNIKFYFKQKIKIPLAILAYEWLYEEDMVREVEEGIVAEGGAVQLKSGEVIPFEKLPKDVQDEILAGVLLPGTTASWYVEKDKPIKNQAVLRYIQHRDYVWTHGTKKGQKPYLEGYRFWQTINEMNLKKKQKEYEIGEVNWNKLLNVLSALSSNATDSITAKTLAERSHKFECFKVFTRLPFNKNDEVDFTDTDALEQEVILEIALKEEVLLKCNKWYYLRYPADQRIFLYGWYEEKDTLTGNPFVGRSMAEKVEDINLLINKEFQQIVDNADLAMTKIFIKKRTILNEEWEEPEVFPGAFWDVEQQGDIQALDVGDVKQIGFQIMDSLLSFAARVSNISPINVSDRMEGGKPLATEINAIMKEGEIGREDIIQSCHEDIRTIYKWTMDYYFQFMPDGLERRVRGDNAELLFLPAPDKAQFQDGASYQKAMADYEKQKFYNREMLVGIGKWDFKWNGTQLSGDREWQIQVSDYLAQILPKFQGLVSLTGTWELLRDILIARGKRDWQKYLVPREKIMAAEQQQEAMQQAQSQQAGQPDLRERLIAKGFPPEVADQAIAKLRTQKEAQPNAPINK